MVHPFIITALKTATLLFGATITYFATRAYRSTGSKALGLLAVGFGIVTLGAGLGGVADVVFGVRQLTALAIESALTATGFGVIAYSLYAEM